MKKSDLKVGQIIKHHYISKMKTISEIRIGEIEYFTTTDTGDWEAVVGYLHKSGSGGFYFHEEDINSLEMITIDTNPEAFL